MTSPAPVSSLQVLIIKPDGFSLSAIKQATTAVIGEARFVTARRFTTAVAALESGPFDLVLTGVGMTDGDGFDLLWKCTRTPRIGRRVFVITEHHEPRILALLRALPINGVFDARNEELERYGPALRTIWSGGTYWSPTLQVKAHGRTVDSGTQLTRLEELVLLAIGDGSDDAAAADWTGLKPTTIKSVRSDLHRKLGVQQRGELMRVAQETGYIRISEDGVVRIGATQAKAAWNARRTESRARKHKLRKHR